MFHLQLIGGAAGEIDFVAGQVGIAIVNPDFDGTPVPEVLDFDD
jgi:hypothetical protein